MPHHGGSTEGANECSTVCAHLHASQDAAGGPCPQVCLSRSAPITKVQRPFYFRQAGLDFASTQSLEESDDSGRACRKLLISRSGAERSIPFSDMLSGLHRSGSAHCCGTADSAKTRPAVRTALALTCARTVGPTTYVQTPTAGHAGVPECSAMQCDAMRASRRISEATTSCGCRPPVVAATTTRPPTHATWR